MTGLRVLVVGSGGREHALAWACWRSPLVGEVICAPGNGGTALLGENVGIAATDVVGLCRLAVERAVGLVVIGPDAAVAAGLADALAARGVPVFGPSAAAGRIESSKRFAKEVMDDTGIPTARWRAVDRAGRENAVAFIEELGGHCVVKADGPALGKGVTICGDVGEAVIALDDCLTGGRFGAAGTVVVVEERLSGPEVSVFALTDGTHIRMLGAACDYKRAEDGDRGPNTGGMGAYSPPQGIEVGELLEAALRVAIAPCVEALAARGTPYAGCLYAGLMLTAAGPRVLEYNARFGDPEAQALLPMLDEDLGGLLLACARGELVDGTVAKRPGACVTVVAASANYPEPSTAGLPIAGLDSLHPDVLCFHAGTRVDEVGVPVTNGGRVLAVSARGEDVADARSRAYANLARISFAGMRFRRDIAVSRVEVG